MNKLIIGTIIGAVALVALAYIYSENESSGATAQSSSAITVVGNDHDFGMIDIFGGKVETSYTLRNEGSESVTITSAITSCMCTEGEIAGLRFGMHGSQVDSVTIEPGEEEVVQATFDPLAHGPEGTGPITRELVLETNSVETPEVRLRFNGNVVKRPEAQ